MARMIDADRLLRELTALSHGQVWPGWTYDGIRLLIERQPTHTQPNEPLTLEELSLFNDPVWIRRIGDADLSGDGWAIVEGPRCLTWHNRIPVSWGIQVWWPGSEVEDYPKYENYGKTWLAYRRPPEGEGRGGGGLERDNRGHRGNPARIWC